MLHAETTATRVEVGAEGRVTAHPLQALGRQRRRGFFGKVFLIAAHAIETPRLLLHSRSEAMPNGVANSSDQVGRNLMDHPTQLSWALAGSGMALSGPLSTSSIEMRIEIGNDGGRGPRRRSRPLPIALGLRGRALDSIARPGLRHLRLASQVEQLPTLRT